MKINECRTRTRTLVVNERNLIFEHNNEMKFGDAWGYTTIHFVYLQLRFCSVSVWLTHVSIKKANVFYQYLFLSFSLSLMTIKGGQFIRKSFAYLVSSTRCSTPESDLSPTGHFSNAFLRSTQFWPAINRVERPANRLGVLLSHFQWSPVHNR